MVGGIGQVDYSVFDGFDYVALGHIHSSYPVGRETVRYAGSPLVYHFNEIRQPAKGPLLVTLGEKGGEIRMERQEIPPLHRMREIRGTYEEIRTEALAKPWEKEYLKIVLTDTRLTPEISVQEPRTCFAQPRTALTACFQPLTSFALVSSSMAGSNSLSMAQFLMTSSLPLQ